MLFTDASYADCLSTSKSTTGIFAALVGPNTFFPINAVCKKQTVVSHSSTESEIVALDTSLRLEGLPLLTFWETVVGLSKPRSSSKIPDCLKQAAQAICPVLAAKKKKNRPSPKKASPSRASSPRRRELPRPEHGRPALSSTIMYEDNVLHVPPPVASQKNPALVPLLIGEDNQAVIKIVQKGRTPALRHLHRTHRIDLGWITEVCAAEPGRA